MCVTGVGSVTRECVGLGPCGVGLSPCACGVEYGVVISRAVSLSLSSLMNGKNEHATPSLLFLLISVFGDPGNQLYLVSIYRPHVTNHSGKGGGYTLLLINLPGTKALCSCLTVYSSTG